MAVLAARSRPRTVLPRLISDFNREQVSQGSDYVYHSRLQAQAPLVSCR
jgi:hypothetical protein